MNNVRNQVISHQSFMQKTAKSKRKNLLDSIKNLQNDPLQNFDELTELENFLNKALDRELRHELEKLSGFSSLGRYVFGSEISYNKAPPRLPGLGC